MFIYYLDRMKIYLKCHIPVQIFLHYLIYYFEKASRNFFPLDNGVLGLYHLQQI